MSWLVHASVKAIATSRGVVCLVMVLPRTLATIRDRACPLLPTGGSALGSDVDWASALRLGGGNSLLVESALMHRIGLAHENVRRDLVLGAAEFSESGKKHQVVECLFRQGQAQLPGF